MQTEYLLCLYWEEHTIVSRSGRYYVNPFKVYREVTLVNPLSPTIFNIVVYINQYQSGLGG